MDEHRAVTALGALAQETRLALYRLLVATGPEGLPAGAIAERLGVAPSSLSFHLQQLAACRSRNPAPRRAPADLCRRIRDDERAARLSDRELLRARAILRAVLHSRRSGCDGESQWMKLNRRSWCAPATAASPRPRVPMLRAAARLRRESACCGPAEAPSLDREGVANGLLRGGARRRARWRQSRPRLRQPAGDRRAAARRDRRRSRQRRRVRLFSRGHAGRPRRPRDRRRHDARDAEKGARQRRASSGRTMSNSASARSSTCRSPTIRPTS